MKTKIIYTCLIGAAALLGISSCTDLKDTNYTNVVADGFQPTDEDVASLLSSAYVSWRKTMLLWNGVARAEMLSTDQDVIPARPNGWVDGGVYKRMHQHKWTSEDEIPLQSWVRTYDGINACNRVLYQIESGQIQLGDRETTIISELKVLRASYYYLLDDLFGNYLSLPSLTYLPATCLSKAPVRRYMSLLFKNSPKIFQTCLKK